ncbi:hypothetical protein [Clostridium sp. YIM B02555]|uniref:hypothetical protein n=1 Tax=Clostridium sp. YIM B02555 TaxID=2911968 RepID=UPI001EED853D|nr:hypothetical protein [Clostridium sp. YIM B02555]
MNNIKHEFEISKEGKRVLPVTYPIITTYTNHAHMLAVLGNNKKALEWIISNYILIYCNKDYAKGQWGDMYFQAPYRVRPYDQCEWLVSDKISVKYILDDSESIVNKVIKWIDEGRYIDIMLDYYYISNSIYYNKESFGHDMLIYGYDLLKKVFYCSDFLFTESNKYTFSTISFDDMENAFAHSIDDKKRTYLNDQIYVFYCCEDCEFEFDEHNIINSLQFYAESKAPEYWRLYNVINQKENMYGLDVYNAVIYYLDNIVNEWCYTKIFYLLYDHKHLMISRLNYLAELKTTYEKYYRDLCARYIEFEMVLKNVTLFMVKYNFSKDKNILNEVKSILKELKCQEKEALSQFFKYVNSGRDSDDYR